MLRQDVCPVSEVLELQGGPFLLQTRVGGWVGRMMAITELPPSPGPSPITAGSMAGPSCGSDARPG